MKEKIGVDEVARDCCMDYISGMSLSLAAKKLDDFDLFHSFYKDLVEGIKERDSHMAHQMNKLVEPLYERRKELIF
jgi:hypothetical protein